MKIEKETEQMMKKAVEHLAEDYKTLRTNRVNPSMLDSLLVAAYGSEVAIKTLGTISVQERNLMITPFDPNLSGSIVKAINASALKVNATNEGSYIKVPVPPLNEELRKGIAKQAKEKLEDAKIWIEKAMSNGANKSAAVLEHYGDILFKLGDITKAIENWEKAKEAGDGASEFLDRKILEKKLFE